MKRPFLTARWSHLVLAQYAVPRELLLPHVPRGLELDERDGCAWASLVAFDFLDTRVLGVPWPGFRNFPEVNLRFYVRGGGRRGVCFVREIVPQRLTCAVARVLYNEPYSPAAMRSRVDCGGGMVRVQHEFDWRGRTQRIAAEAQDAPRTPPPESLEHFFKEHEWGFGRTRGGRTLVYEVRHPRWEVFPVVSHDVRVEWSHVYGERWRAMDGAQPASVILARGSGVEVFGAREMA